MAANPKTLRVVAAHSEGACARVLEIETVDASPLTPVAGKYIIVNTGVMAGDKPVKRAYSLTSAYGPDHRARLIVKKLGPGSSALHDAALGAEFSFSGPWGKLLPEAGEPPCTLVVATDTGITTAIGLATQASTLSTCRVAEVLWLRGEGETFLDVDDVRHRIEAAGVKYVCATILPAHDPARVNDAWAHVEARVAEVGAEVVLASGDGAIIHPLRTRLAEAVREVRIECFFHNPEKKSA